MSWIEKFSKDLQERDKREKYYDSMFDASANRLEEESGTGIHSDAASPDQAKELSKLYSELSLKSDLLSKREAMLTSLKAENELLTQDLRALQTKVQFNSEEQEAKSRNIQQILDEMLSLQIQLNLSEQKIVKLEEENKVLIDRWMAKVAGEADQMNEALSTDKKMMESIS